MMKTQIQKVEEKYYLCQSLTKDEWQILAIEYMKRYKTLETIIKNRIAGYEESITTSVKCLPEVELDLKSTDHDTREAAISEMHTIKDIERVFQLQINLLNEILNNMNVAKKE